MNKNSTNNNKRKNTESETSNHVVVGGFGGM